MINPNKNEKTIGITGASGALGKELTKLFRQKGYKVIGFTHSKTNYEINLESPNKWIKWECGKESSLKKQLEKIDILILNHGIYDLSRENLNYEKSIEILFSGKIDLNDIPILLKMKKEGLIQRPIFLPEWVTDMNYLVSYFVFSNFVGKMDYDRIDNYYDALF